MPKFKQKQGKPTEAVAVKFSKVRELYERTLAIADLAQVNLAMSKQDNVKVIVPAKGLELGYEITCSRATYLRKYSHLKMVEL